VPNTQPFCVFSRLPARIPALPFCQVRLSARKPRATHPREVSILGDHLRKGRLKLGLLQREVAQRLGTDVDSICRWETGYSQPKPYLIPRIVDFLGYAPWTAPATFGQWLLMARRTVGYSRERLADRLGVDEGTVFGWERDRRRPDTRLRNRLTRLLTSCGK
jgi:transcriptional regulator with XRE-family HTH domain